MHIVIALLVVAVGAFLVYGLIKVEQGLAKHLAELKNQSEEKVERQLKEVIERQNVIQCSIDAYVAALTRVDNIEELRYLTYHYGAVKTLYALRAEGISEEKIAKERMSFSSGGWTVPFKNAESGEYERHRISPYFLATNNAEIKTWVKQTQEAARDSESASWAVFGVNPELEWPNSKIIHYPVTYRNGEGEYVTYSESSES